MGLELYSEPRPLNFRQKALLIGAAGLSLFSLYKLQNSSEAYEKKIEDCVSEIVGYEVDLVANNDDGQLDRPASVFEEQGACMTTNGDAEKAKMLLGK